MHVHCTCRLHVRGIGTIGRKWYRYSYIVSHFLWICLTLFFRIANYVSYTIQPEMYILGKIIDGRIHHEKRCYIVDLQSWSHFQSLIECLSGFECTLFRPLIWKQTVQKRCFLMIFAVMALHVRIFRNAYYRKTDDKALTRVNDAKFHCFIWPTTHFGLSARTWCFTCATLDTGV